MQNITHGHPLSSRTGSHPGRYPSLRPPQGLLSQSSTPSSQHTGTRPHLPRVLGLPSRHNGPQTKPAPRIKHSSTPTASSNRTRSTHGMSRACASSSLNKASSALVARASSSPCLPNRSGRKRAARRMRIARVQARLLATRARAPAVLVPARAGRPARPYTATPCTRQARALSA